MSDAAAAAPAIVTALTFIHPLDYYHDLHEVSPRVIYMLSDTMRIERPLFCRRQSDRGGRIKYDSRGNPILVKTRVSDFDELPTLHEAESRGRPAE